MKGLFILGNVMANSGLILLAVVVIWGFIYMIRTLIKDEAWLVLTLIIALTLILFGSLLSNVFMNK